ncbi:hypothetical protein J6590_025261 [Homalodisca vitripennis]|nr:hypothetical protein J6590_025261 [Homalodisca vitripennis]
MKPGHLRSRSNEKLTHTKKIKPVLANKKHPPAVKAQCTTVTDAGRPGSCPTSNSTWAPSRNWHKYLTNTKLQSEVRPHSPLNHQQEVWLDRGSKSEGPKLAHTKPPDELVMKLPVVNFCNVEGEIPPTKLYPSIGDLSDDDKRKIAHLVEELARCKQEKEEDEEKILNQKNRISELKLLLKTSNADKRTVSELKSQYLDEQVVLKKQLSELNQLLYQMQVQKSTSDIQIKTITAQAEKMTRAIHAMHRENTELQVELRVTQEKLSVAQQALDKMTKDIKDVREQITPTMEDKACQSSDAIGSEETIHVKTLKRSEDVPSDDQKILTELFFNKSLQNDFSPKETIIFLPENSNALLQQF